MALQLSERPVPNGVVLELTGDLTYAHREEFRGAVERLRQRGCRHLILDLAGVRFVDSSGLGLLALVAQHFQLAQGRVSLAAAELCAGDHEPGEHHAAHPDLCHRTGRLGWFPVGGSVTDSSLTSMC